MLTAMVAFFTCPVCLDLIHHDADFGVCFNGHVACIDCTKKLYTSPCPVCRGASLKIRPINYILKGMHALLCHHLHLPCPFANTGCPEAMLAKDVGNHVEQCRFRPYRCLSPSCPKRRSFHDMANEKCDDHYIIAKCLSLEKGWSFTFYFSAIFNDKVSVVGDGWHHRQSNLQKNSFWPSI